MLRAVCTRAQVQRLKESRLTIRGDGDQDPVASEEVTELRWVHYVGQTSDQRMPATLVLDNSLLKILRWPNVGPMYTVELF